MPAVDPLYLGTTGFVFPTPTPGSAGSIVAPSIVVTDAADGGDFTVAVTADAVGPTTTVYAAPFGGGLGPLAPLTTVGIVTGSAGTINGHLPVGFYLFYAISTYGGLQAASLPAYARISSAADSLHEQLQVASLARIQALALPGIAEVRRIKLPDEARLNNVLFPCCLLTTWRQSEEYLDDAGTNARDDTILPVLVGWLSPDLNDDTTDARVTLWRQLVRRAFRAGQRLPVTGAVHYETRFERGPVIDVAANGTDYAMSTLVLRFVCREPRGLGV